MEVFAALASLSFARSTSSFAHRQRHRACPHLTAFDFEGFPSTPGWESGRLDQLTNWAVSVESNRPVICEYKSDGLWLWTKWRGTVLSISVLPVLLTMGLGVATDVVAHSLSSSTWAVLAVPPEDDMLIQQLQGLNKLWEYQLTLSTFILTFFTSQAYSHWRSVYFTTRAIQGRLNDICMLLVMGAERQPAAAGDVTEYTEDAALLLEHVSRLVRLSHTFFWAATPTSSNGVGDVGLEDGDGNSDVREVRERQRAAAAAPIGPLLLSRQGLDGLVRAGELRESEVENLYDSGLPPSQFCYVLLEWVGLHAMAGLRSGTLRGGNGFEDQLVQQILGVRAQYFSIGDYTAGRMPLAYVQLVQVLVDSLVVLAPLALYPELGSLSVPAVGLLTLFFKGLLELSKSFLDPFGNEGYPAQNIRVDVLVSELNFGAAKRWRKAGAALPGLSANSSWSSIQGTVMERARDS